MKLEGLLDEGIGIHMAVSLSITINVQRLYRATSVLNIYDEGTFAGFKLEVDVSTAETGRVFKQQGCYVVRPLVLTNVKIRCD